LLPKLGRRPGGILITVDVIRAIPGFCQPVSSLTHLAAAAVGVVAAVPLVRLARGHRHRVVAVAVYVFCVIATLAISGVYHSLERGCVARAVMKRFDYFAIWLLIAGTFTAVHGVMFEGRWRSGVLTFIWSYVALGVALQAIWFRVFSGVPGLLLYLGLGWIGVISVVKLGRQLGYAVVRPLWYAGIAYSFGAILEATGHPMLVYRWVGPHEVFHLAVIVGVALHWVFIRRLLMSHAPLASSSAVSSPLPLVAA
jgi:channel protein (hemolysin III family)